MCWDFASLQEVSLPKSLTKLGKQCFKHCTALKSIILPDNISMIDESAFEECNALETIAVR
ncbi:leucine-rich repeat protein [Hallella colorans]|uniref:leucine-rich repeat protein n=1 Tax=Hallella colorans TaxID=1703337 RepID=UPI0023F1D30B|nr:leucine-rich repeat protein [Hallella colorans]